MIFDPSRPCSSKTKAQNRYTRKELEEVAEYYGIKNIKTKKMDELCQELAKASLTKSSASSVPSPSKAVKSVYSMLKGLFTPVDKPTKPCGTKFAKKGGYTRTEIEAIAKKNNIKNISKKNMDQLCEELKNVLQTTMVVDTNPSTKVILQKPLAQKSKKKSKQSKPVSKKSKTTKTPTKPKNTQAKMKAKQKKVLKMIHKKDPNAFRPNYYFNEEKRVWQQIPGTPSQVFSYLQLKSVSDASIRFTLMNEYGLLENYIQQKFQGKSLPNVLLRMQASKILLGKFVMDYPESLPKLERVVKELKKDDVIWLTTFSKSYNESQRRSMLFNVLVSTDSSILSKEQINQLREALHLGTFTHTQQSLNVIQDSFPNEFKILKTNKKAVETVATKLLQYKLKKAPISNRVRVTLNNPYGVYASLLRSGKIETTRKSYSVYGYSHLPKNWIANDASGITQNNQWFGQQAAYQKKLQLEDQLLVFSYTYGGDQMYHQWLTGNFNRVRLEHSIEPEYINKMSYIFPVLVILYKKYKLNQKTFQSFIRQNFRSVMKPVNIKSLIEYMSISVNEVFQQQNQIRMLRWLQEYLPVAKQSFYDHLFEDYGKYLNHIINSAPTSKHKIVVYKGVKDRDFIQFDKKTSIYENKFFVSTSIDFSVATKFTSPGKACCLLKITILPGTKCLFPIFTYFPHEKEILFPTLRKFYLTKDAYLPDNDKSYNTQNVVVVN